MKKPFALFINSPEAIPLIVTLYPPAKKMDYVKDLHKHFIVINFPKKGNVRFMKQKAFREMFRETEYGHVQIRIP